MDEAGWECDHARMRFCCDYDCGHLICPDCGLFWDEGEQPPELEYEDPGPWGPEPE